MPYPGLLDRMKLRPTYKFDEPRIEVLRAVSPAARLLFHVTITCTCFQLFEERPVWSRTAVQFRTGIQADQLKFTLPLVSYYWITGPKPPNVIKLAAFKY